MYARCAASARPSRRYGCLEEQWHCVKAIEGGPVRALFTVAERTREMCLTPAPVWSLGNLCEK